MTKMTITNGSNVTFSPSPTSRHSKRVQDHHLHQMVASRITLLAIVIKTKSGTKYLGDFSVYHK